MDLVWHSVHLIGPPIAVPHSSKSNKVWKKPKPHYKIEAHSWQRAHLGESISTMLTLFIAAIFPYFSSFNSISVCNYSSEIYTTPRLAESLENSMSFSSSCLTNANLGHINSNTTTINNSHLQQKHRIDALTTISTGSTTIPTTNTLSTSSLSQSMDSIVDSKLRQGQYWNEHFH